MTEQNSSQPAYTTEKHSKGDGREKYLITTTGHIEWMEPDLLVIDDLDLALTPRSKAALAKYLSFSAKLMKLLSDNGENHGKFKSIFASIASTQNLDIVVKVETNEENQDVAVGFLSPSVFRILNDAVKQELLPQLIAHPHIHLRYMDVSAEDSTLVFCIEDLENPTVLEFAGKKWQPGFVVNNSSIGLYTFSVTPALIPHKSVSFYSLPFSVEGVVLYPSSWEEIVSPQFVNDCLGMAKWCAKGINNWEKRLNNELSVNEYQNLMSCLLPRQDLIPEQKILGRLALIYDAHNISPEDGKPSKLWAKSAMAGTLVSEFLKISLDLDLENEWECAPVYGVGKLLDNTTDLEGAADNSSAKAALDNLTWPVNTNE
ncbi:hypothetical protein [Ewingella americana]|uniref:Uncharacterized protein n=1 Tax=Ewingella americana TaxID=41202 RepID=A0A502GH11_9GAMM|nr:hypothetical protein [Ewingella americana]TPG60013.1 hypothetical protein EAH77_15715 [Ewingella americana]